jgi:trehalose-6-phosphate synthase
MKRKQKINQLVDELTENKNKPKSQLILDRFFQENMEYEYNFMHIKISRESLKKIGRLIIEIAECQETTFHAHPRGAGSAFFEEGSDCGLFIELVE